MTRCAGLAGKAALLLLTGLLLGSLARCCSAVEQAPGAAGAATNAAGASAAAPRRPAAAAAGEEGQDDSVRCRLSGICEGPPSSCGVEAEGSERDREDARLACLTADAERAAAVQEAARHAWGGYRCAGMGGRGRGLPKSCRGGAVALQLPVARCACSSSSSSSTCPHLCVPFNSQGLRLGAG